MTPEATCQHSACRLGPSPRHCASAPGPGGPEAAEPQPIAGPSGVRVRALSETRALAVTARELPARARALPPCGAATKPPDNAPSLLALRPAALALAGSSPFQGRLWSMWNTSRPKKETQSLLLNDTTARATRIHFDSPQDVKANQHSWC